MALSSRQAGLKALPPSHLIHHSDQGSQYARYDYRDMLDKNHLMRSMGRRGNCYDHAVLESCSANL